MDESSKAPNEAERWEKKSHVRLSIKIEKAGLEAELDALWQEKDAEAAPAKAVIMDAATAELSPHGCIVQVESLPSLEGSHEKVNEYIAKHASAVSQMSTG